MLLESNCAFCRQIQKWNFANAANFDTNPIFSKIANNFCWTKFKSKLQQMFNHWCYIIRQLLTNPSWLTLIWWLPLVPDKNNADFKVNSSIKLLIGITSGWYCYTWAEWTTQWFYGRKLDASKVVDSLMTSGQNFWTTWQQLTTGDNGDLEYAYCVVFQSPLCLGKCFIGIRCWKIWEVFFELPSSYGMMIFVFFLHIIMIMVS